MKMLGLLWGRSVDSAGPSGRTLPAWIRRSLRLESVGRDCRMCCFIVWVVLDCGAGRGRIKSPSPVVKRMVRVSTADAALDDEDATGGLWVGRTDITMILVVIVEVRDGVDS